MQITKVKVLTSKGKEIEIELRPWETRRRDALSAGDFKSAIPESSPFGHQYSGYDEHGRCRGHVNGPLQRAKRTMPGALFLFNHFSKRWHKV